MLKELIQYNSKNIGVFHVLHISLYKNYHLKKEHGYFIKLTHSDIFSFY